MLGSGEIIVILCVVLILFGGKKLPEFARSLGKGIREFKRACQGEDDSTPTLYEEVKTDDQVTRFSKETDENQK